MVTKPEVKTQKEVTLMVHTNDHIVKHKVGLLNLADEPGNIAQACKMMMAYPGIHFIATKKPQMTAV